MGSSPAKSISSLNEKNKSAASSYSSSKWISMKNERQISLSDIAELSKIAKQPLESINKALKYLEERNIIIENGILGIGGCGFVLRAFSLYNDHLAVKFLRSSDREKTIQNKKEFKKLQKFNSPFIIKVYDFFHEMHNEIDFQVIVMERCVSDLKKYITKKIKPSETFNLQSFYSICYQLANGLKELHSKDIIHLDIKPANILLGMDLKWKYADLGIAKKVSKDKQFTNSLIGFTAIYSSPEQYQLANKSKSSVSKSSDIYSLGIVFLELTGVDVNQKWIMQEKIKQGNYDQCLNPNYEEFNNQVIKRMIKYKAEDRLDVSELITILRDLKNGKKTLKNSKISDQQDSLNQNNIEELSNEELKEINLCSNLNSENQRFTLNEDKDSFNQIVKKRARHSLNQQLFYSNEQLPTLRLPILSPQAQPSKSNLNIHYQMRSQYSNGQQNYQQIFDNSPHSQNENHKQSSFNNNNMESPQQIISQSHKRKNSFLPQIKSTSNLQQNSLVSPKITHSHIQQSQQQHPSQQQPESFSLFSPEGIQRKNNRKQQNSTRLNTFLNQNHDNHIYVTNFN